jgi:hypothetical protein
MPHATKIFISHSAHQAEDKLILKELEERLKEAGLHPYCDRRLRAGDEFRNEIYTAIGCSHAAVVLLTREALDVQKHPWVYQECSMFTLLRWAEKEFPLFPITMTGVTAADVKGSPFESLLVQEIQAADGADLERLVAVIADKLKSVECSAETEPLYHHHRRIADRLRVLMREEYRELLREIVEGNQSTLDDWDPLDRELPYRAARALLTLGAEGVVEALRSAFPALGKNEACTLIDFLAPFWFDLPAVARLEDGVQRDQRAVQAVPDESEDGPATPRRAFGLNAFKTETGFMHATRPGYLKKDLYRVITFPSDAATDDVGYYSRHISASMRSRRGGGELGTSARLDSQSRSLAKRRPTFVILPRGTEKVVVEELRRRFWPMVFIVLTGDDDPAEWDIPEFEMLEPPLKAEHEKLACDKRSDVMDQAYTIIEGC